jgi:molybdenum cofactor cytidylyltransferase
MHVLKLDRAARPESIPEHSLVCHDVRDAGLSILARKGQPLGRAEVQQLLEQGVESLHLAVPAPGDLTEDDAALRLATAVAGPGVALGSAHYGQVAIASDVRGLLRIDAERLDRVNSVDGVLVMTAESHLATDAGTQLGVIKCAPLLMPAQIVKHVESIGPVLEVTAFVPMRTAFVAPAARLRGNAFQRATDSLAAALTWHGSTLDTVLAPEASVSALSEAFSGAVAAGAELILAAGAAATDPLDVVFDGLRQAGGEVEQIGIPAEPGTACWIGRVDGRAVLGLASCELFGRPGALDLLLPRLLIGESLDRPLLRRIALGGLLLGGPTRVAPYHRTAD